MRVKFESLLQRLQKLEARVARLERKQRALEDSILSMEDIKAIAEAERELKRGELVPWETLKQELEIK